MGRGRKQKPVAEKSPCDARHCQNHIFELTSLMTDRRLRLDCKLEFCPRLSNISKKYESIVPRLNADGKIYTPCFILESDVAHYRERDDRYREIHQLKLEEYLRSRKELLEPKHARKSLTCAVCRCVYVDYREHILSQAHKLKVRQSAYNDHILELIASCEREHRLEPEDSEQTDAQLKVLSVEMLSAKPKRLRRAEKLAAKKSISHLGISHFTEASRLQERTPRESEEGSLGELQPRSFRVEDYLLL